MHDIANDLAALRLLLAAIGLADDDEERSRHLGAAKQAIVDGESRLQALREAVRRELRESKSTSAGRLGSRRAAFVDRLPDVVEFEDLVPAIHRVSAPSGAKASSKRVVKSAARPINKRIT